MRGIQSIFVVKVMSVFSLYGIEGASAAHGLYISISLCLLFVLFVLATSRKSTNSGKYHLLEKRNPFYFLAYFFYFLVTFFTFQLTFYINFTYTNSNPNIGPPPSFVFFNLPVHFSSNHHQILYTSFGSVY